MAINDKHQDISTLRNWDKNPRAIKQDKFEELKSRIIKRGQIKPLIITPDGEVLGGNMRLRAYQELGIKDIWVSVVEPKSEADKIEIALTDNEEMGYYEDQALAELIAEYKNDIDLSKYSVHLGKPQTLEEILKQFSPDEITEDEAPEVTDDPVSKLGEVYQLGRHRVMCGDSTKIEDVGKLMDGKKADMVFTDPPYGIDADKMKLGIGKQGFHRGSWDSERPDILFLLALADKVCIWGGNYFADVLPVTNDWLCWHKKNDDRSFSEFELAWTNFGRNSRLISHHWGNEKKEHVTMKPVSVMAWGIEQIEEAQTILDPFLGSGSTLIACEQTNRTCFGMELDPKYCDVIRKRYAKFIDSENWEAKWIDMTPKTGNEQE